MMTLALAASQCACTVIHGDATKGTYTFAGLGSDAKEYTQSASGVTAGSIDNSTSFRDVTKTVRWGLVAAATQGIASDLAGAYKSVTAAKEATKAAGIRSAADVEKAKIAADVTKSTFEPAATPTP